MSLIIVPALLGFLGGIVAVIASYVLVKYQLAGHNHLIVSAQRAPEHYKDVEVLEHAPRPQGRYIRYRNRGTKTIQMASFKVSGYKEDKLWADSEECIHSVVEPGKEHEAILRLVDYRNPMSPIDLSECRVDVRFTHGYVLFKETAKALL